MLDFNMEYLRTFYYVASLKSISKAADALYITQPACTQTIKKLENYMGTELFYRKSRSTELTPAGALLFKHVRQGSHAFLNGEKELVRSKVHSAGTLSISATETPLFSVILPMLSTFREQHPEAKIRLFGGGSTAASLKHLQSEEADLAIGVTPFQYPDEYTIYEGIAFPIIAVAGNNYVIEESHPLTVRELSCYPIICPGRDSSAYAQISQYFIEQGTFFEPSYSVQTSSTIQILVENNYGIGILPEILVEKKLRNNKMKKVELEITLPKRNLIVMHRKQLSQSSLCEAFLRILFENKILRK